MYVIEVVVQTSGKMVQVTFIKEKMKLYSNLNYFQKWVPIRLKIKCEKQNFKTIVKKNV